MSRLTAAQRNALPDSAFAGPNRSFPVNDANHAKAAIMLSGNAGKSKALVIAAAQNALKKRKKQGLSPVAQALSRKP